MKKQDNPALELEKLTLTAWTNILYKKGMIDSGRQKKMLVRIEHLTESGNGKPVSRGQYSPQI